MKRFCAFPLCPEKVEGKERHCPAHKTEYARQDVRRRGSSAERGYSWRWAEYSRKYRQASPLCVRCRAEGRLSPSEQVDHIQPVTGPDDPLFWDPSNHAALCTPCHSAKTREDVKQGKTRTGGR